MADLDEVTVTVGGTAYGGWTETSIDTSMDTMAAGFKLTLTERWPGQPQRQMVKAGDKCVVAIGGEPVVTGIIDEVEIDLDGSTHRISADGRSMGGQLADCSAVAASGSWTNLSLEAIAAQIATPLGVRVVADSSTAPVFAKFALQSGESCWDAIDRMARQRGLIGVSFADGSVHLVAPKPGPASVTLTEGVHPFKINARHKTSDRFATYIAIGQASGNDQHYGAAVAHPKALATDAGMPLPRTLVIVAEDQATPASLQARAQWEANVRAAKAQRLTLTLPRWRQPGGALWAIMQLVRVVAPSAWIDDSLMVVKVNFVSGSGGKNAVLELARPEAYTQEPVAAGAQPSTITSNKRPKTGRFA